LTETTQIEFLISVSCLSDKPSKGKNYVKLFLGKTFGGLSKRYYFRQLMFGLILLVFMLAIASKSLHGVRVVAVAFFILNTFLYPYARFVYEGIANFVLGENQFWLTPLIEKFSTMALCWIFAWVLAPVGLAYLYFHNSKSHSG
jgi:hypothetical protein